MGFEVAFDVISLADFEIYFVIVELAFGVPGEVVPDVPLAAPCVVDEEVSAPDETK